MSNSVGLSLKAGTFVVWHRYPESVGISGIIRDRARRRQKSGT